MDILIIQLLFVFFVTTVALLVLEEQQQLVLLAIQQLSAKKNLKLTNVYALMAIMMLGLKNVFYATILVKHVQMQ